MASPVPGTTPALYTPPTTAVSQVNETAAAALGARARADIEARTIVALNRPRDTFDFRRRLLDSCARREFAGLARYSKPLGGNKFAEGFTIRFAEECVRFYRNLDLSTMVVSEDDERRVVRCSVTDLESNVPWSTEVVVPKTVERRSTTKDDEVIRSRTNSTGQTVFIRRATEDEVANSQNRLCAKAMRNLILNHIPSDILEDAENAVLDTVKKQEAEEATDPTTVRKQVGDMFYRIGVTAQQLAEFLGHPFETMTPAELHVLRKVFNGMKSEGVTWAEVMEQKRGAQKPDAPAPQQGRHTSGVDAALDKAEAKMAPAPEPQAPAAAPEPAKPKAFTIAESQIDALALLNDGRRVAPDVLEDLRQLVMDAPRPVLDELITKYPSAMAKLGVK